MHFPLHIQYSFHHTRLYVHLFVYSLCKYATSFRHQLYVSRKNTRTKRRNKTAVISVTARPSPRKKFTFERIRALR